MERYSSIDDAWVALCSRCLYEGTRRSSRAGPTYEMLDVGFTIQDVELNVLTVEGRLFDPRYAAGEMLWYLSGSGDIEQIAHYAPSYRKFGVDGVAPGAYGPRIKQSLPYLVELLKKTPDTRQAVLPIWQCQDTLIASTGQSPDIPCTVMLHFMLRDGRLRLTTYMRSNDLWLGFPYDTFCFMTLQRVVADLLDVRAGSYTHLVGSLHIYEAQVHKTRAAISSLSRAAYNSPPKPLQPSFMKLEQYVAMERALRTGEEIDGPRLVSLLEQWPLLGDLVACAKGFRGNIKSHALQQVYDRRYPIC